MKSLFLIAFFLGFLREVWSATNMSRSIYSFYRNMDTKIDLESRRDLGGRTAQLSDFPAVAALLDRYWSVRCSGSIIAEYWAITAAHCVTSHVAYIKYNTRSPSATDGDSSPVLYLYRHPNYKIVQEDEGNGMDVTVLNHDIGLLRSRDKILLKVPPKPVSAILNYSPVDLLAKEVTVMGFGRTDNSKRALGEQLFAIKMTLRSCERSSWYHSICGTVPKDTSSRGVCSGDSGGPVVYEGVQVGVTSMGPLECATGRSLLAEGAVSVFVSLYQYVELINTTIQDTEIILRIRANNANTTVPSTLHSLVSMFFITCFL